MGERGVATQAMLAIARDVADDRVLAGLICRACVGGLDVDGAALQRDCIGLFQHRAASGEFLAARLDSAVVAAQLFESGQLLSDRRIRRVSQLGVAYSGLVVSQ